MKKKADNSTLFTAGIIAILIVIFVVGFIGDHKKKIESMPAWEKYFDERKKKADEYMKQAEDAKREAEDLKKNEEKNILEKAREIIGRLMLSVDIDPDKGDSR